VNFLALLNFMKTKKNNFEYLFAKARITIASTRTKKESVRVTYFAGYAERSNVRFPGRVQSVSATLYLFTKRWSVCNGLQNTDLLHGRPEGRDVGSLAAGRDLPLDRPAI